jgi:hypothetical protein
MKRSMIGRLVTLVALVVLATAGMAAAQAPPAAPPPAAPPPAAPTDPGAAHDAAIAAAGKSAPTAQELAFATAALTVNQQVAASCSICYTCGGDWPIYAGTLPTARAATERDSSCSGGLTTNRNDTIPFLCCR